MAIMGPRGWRVLSKSGTSASIVGLEAAGRAGEAGGSVEPRPMLPCCAACCAAVRRSRLRVSGSTVTVATRKGVSEGAVHTVGIEPGTGE